MAIQGLKAQSFSALTVPAKFGLGGLVVAVLGVLYFSVFHMSLVSDLEQADRERVTLQAEMTRLDEAKRRYLEINRQLAERTEEDKRNYLILPEKAEMASFLEDLNRLAEVSGLSFRSVEPKSEEDDDFYVRIPVALTFSGKFYQFARFAYNVSRLDRAINLENIQLSKPRIDGEEILLDVAVLATTFRRREGAAPGGSAKPGVRPKQKGRS